MLNDSLLTPYGEALDKQAPLPEYPRPQLRRDSYLNLNGIWQYAITAADTLPAAFSGNITVPFPVESCLSGVGRALKASEYLVYSRKFTVSADFLRNITLLHIGAADQLCEVFLNGVAVGSHAGGYLPFTFDVSAAVHTGENTLTVRVKDALDYTYPTGKQRQKRGGIWYTPVSGIWQTVWLESVNSGYIKGLKITPDIDRRCVDILIDSDADSFSVTITADKETVTAVNGGHRLTIPLPAMRLWSPETPFLYGLTVSSPDDTVSSYFAMRKFTVNGDHFLLNNQPYFVNGLLDQGYFSDGIYTPAAYAAFRDDITAMKALGFNTLRKHIKIEPMLFYYYCDTVGMLVLQDMVNVGKYSFFKDTVLPFAGLRHHVPYRTVNAAQRKAFTAHALETVQLLYNCPSVVYYTIFNEGWGQFDGDGLYAQLKAADPTRVYDATSGWFWETRSDVDSEHIYFKPICVQHRNRPVIVSECGGYSYSCPGHVFNTDKVFGYRKYTDPAAFEQDFIALYEQEILPQMANGLAGVIYTQVSDVEDETNGILTYDRRCCKLHADRILPLMQRVVAAGSQ